MCNLQLDNYVYIGQTLYVLYVVFHREHDSEVRIKLSHSVSEMERLT